MRVDPAFPLRVDGHGRTALASYHEHVRDLVEQLLFTNPGERVMRPGFGCGLTGLVFAPDRPELAATLELSVHAALRQWLGELIEVEALDVTGDGGTIRVDLRYVVRRTGERRAETFAAARDGGVHGE